MREKCPVCGSDKNLVKTVTGKACGCGYAEWSGLHLFNKEKGEMSIYIESMTKFSLPGLKIRIWREEKETPEDPGTFDKPYDLQEAMDRLDVHKSFYEMAKELLEIERVNAVEILDPAGDGIVIYKDWP